MRIPIAGILLLATGWLVLLNAGCSRQARMARHLEQANRYFASGQYDQAEVEYLNVLQIERLNPAAITGLGLLYRDQGRIERALPLLAKAQELQPDDLNVRLNLGLASLGVGDLKTARDAANYVLDRRPQDPQAPLLLAEAAGPKDVEATRQRLEKLSPSTAPSAPALVALGRLELRLRRIDQAEAAFLRAQALDPKSADVSTGLASLYWDKKDLPRAEAAFKQAADRSPPRSPKRLQYARFQIQNGALDAAKRYLEEMTRNTPDYLPAWIWQADIALTEKKYDEGRTLLANVLARDQVNPDALLMSARLRLAKGENDQAVAELEKMLALYPKSARVCYQLGLAYIAKGEMAKAADALNETVTLAPGLTEAAVVLAEVNLRKGDSGTAIVALKRLTQEHPEIVHAWLLLAEAYRDRGDLDNALAIYTHLAEQFPRNAQAPLLRGETLLQQGKRDDARKAFERAQELAPDFAPPLEQLVNLDLNEKNYPAARLRVESELAKHPKAAAPQLLLAKVLLAQQDRTGAEAALRKAVDLDPDTPVAYLLLAQLNAGSSQYPKALADLNSLIAHDPKNIPAWMLIAVIQDQHKNYPAAREAYEKVLALNPKFGAALNNLAYLDSEQFHELDRARELAQRARELLPQDPRTADTLGLVLYRQHQYIRALGLFQESAGKLPADAEIQFHLGLTQYEMGAEEPARQALKRALQLNPEFPGSDEARQRLSILEISAATAGAAERALLEKAAARDAGDPVVLARLAGLYAREGNAGKAIRAYESALGATPGNLPVLMGLSRLYASQGDTDKAFELSKTARSVAPDDPDVAHVLGCLAYQTGDFRWAASLLDEAARSRPDDPETLFDFANAAYSVGRVPEAEAAMRHALQTTSLFSRASTASRFLQMVALAGEPKQALADEDAIEQVLKSEPADVPALMALAAAREQKADWPGATKAYEEAVKHFPSFAPAHKRLAILYAENSPDNPKAVDEATKARLAFPNDPDLAKAFGVIVYRQGDFARAASLLQQSAAARTGDAELLYYLGMAQYRLNKRAESKQALQGAIDLHLREDLASEARKILTALK